VKRKEEMNGNGNKIALMAIAVVAVGIFALPGTVSLFSGQHAWYGLDDTGNQVPCVKCHADIADEYLMSGVHKTLAGGNGSSSGSFGAGYDINDGCVGCHRTNLTGYTYASGDGTSSTPGKEVHAAATIACMECHEYGTFYPFAGGFASMTNSTFNYDAGHPEIDGTKAAHNTFIQGAIDDDRMEDSNEACIACHTYIPVKINWTHAYSLEFNATYLPGGGYFVTNRTHFNVTDWSVNGTINVTSYGNASGGANTSNFPTPVTIWDE